jgi:hypothetical protein
MRNRDELNKIAKHKLDDITIIWLTSIEEVITVIKHDFAVS